MRNIFPILIFGLVFGALLANFSTKTDSNQIVIRRPSSQKMMGKHQRLFDIEISTPTQIAPDPHQETELQATVTLLQEINAEIHYRWILPDQVRLADGEDQDSVVGLQSGSHFIRKLTVTGLSSKGEPQVVVLQVFAEVDAVNMGSAGVFSTKPSDLQLSGQSLQAQSAEQKVKSMKLPKSIQD